MKTNYLSGRNLSIYAVFGLIGLLASSCGSYQNSSYYDNDGVYGSSQRPYSQNQNRYSEENLEQGNRYKEYFAANKDNYSDGNEAFTDVENYNSQTNDTVARNQQNNYAGWGDNNKNVTINYYNNDYWGWNSPYYGWGWNSWYSPRWSWGWNSWYGNYWNVGFGWGWNSPYYGWGWNSWYYPYYSGYYYPYNNYYGHHHYIGGTRDGYSNYGNRGRTYSNPGIYSGGRGNSLNNPPSPRNNNFSNPRNPNFNNPRNNNTINPRNNSVNPRNNDVNPRNNNVIPRGNQYQDPSPRPRINPGNEPRPRSSDYSSPRSNNNYSAPRSSGGYSSPRSSGSSNGGGGGSYGGGRSGGGGGGRR